ncbi:hypothetical protein QT972_34980, partial [Microcoleus sp. herbarium7]|uniref:hypothetical protein n=1 Tax=Microcoleus sp. herbarium7 TaxID=3055435 RepID=UPI002FD64D92
PEREIEATIPHRRGNHTSPTPKGDSLTVETARVVYLSGLKPLNFPLTESFYEHQFSDQIA